MNVRRKWRELMEQPGLVLIPGCYDALSARTITNSIPLERTRPVVCMDSWAAVHDNIG